MKRTLAPLAMAAATLALASCAAPAPTADVRPAPLDAAKPAPARKAPPTDLEQLAERLVRQSAAVREGEVVLVNGNAEDLELVENIAVQVRKAGAFPLVSVYTDRLARRMYADVPEKYDTQVDALDLKMAEIADVVISASNALADGLFADADPRRMAARAKAGEAAAEAFRKNNVRTVEVGNGLYPTAWRAGHFGMTEDELAKTFWGGVNVDYTDLQARGRQVRDVLSAGNELHIRDANGTDLKVRVQGRAVGVSDGIISPEDAKKGGDAVLVYLPAGEVYVTPVPGTAEGKVVRPKEFFEGKEIQNLTLQFAAGRLVSVTGEGEGFAKFKAQYDASGAGKDIFAAVDLGINTSVKLPASAQVGTWVPAGTVTVGVGNNVWAGGDNKTSYGYFVSLTGATVTLDGRAIVENGQLKI